MTRAALFDIEIDRLDMEGTVLRCERLIEDGGFAQHVAINASKVMSLRGDERMREIVRNCELVTADGQSVVWASKLLGDPLPTRVAGIDLMFELFELAERRGYRVFILGATNQVLNSALARLQRRYPRLRVAGARDGYFRPEEGAEVAEQVRRARPDMLFVAISSPKKEYWLGRHGRSLGVPFAMGVGGAIDVAAGVTGRAPALLQRAGLEWAWRLAQEPRRLFKRYLTTNAGFTLLVLGEAAARLLRRRRRDMS
jgi:N-acetylglucosaminyldiphosphoundecaprenol N-acetyl-beta-D-mannosaminyltransferase